MNPNAFKIPEAHKLVASVAHELAEARYEMWARDNTFYKKFPGRKGRREFVRRAQSALIPEARAQLARMLTMDYPESVKDAIHGALIMDNTLTRGRISRAEAAKAIDFKPQILGEG